MKNEWTHLKWKRGRVARAITLTAGPASPTEAPEPYSSEMWRILHIKTAFIIHFRRLVAQKNQTRAVKAASFLQRMVLHGHRPSPAHRVLLLHNDVARLQTVNSKNESFLLQLITRFHIHIFHRGHALSTDSVEALNPEEKQRCVRLITKLEDSDDWQKGATNRRAEFRNRLWLTVWSPNHLFRAC